MFNEVQKMASLVYNWYKEWEHKTYNGKYYMKKFEEKFIKSLESFLSILFSVAVNSRKNKKKASRIANFPPAATPV